MPLYKNLCHIILFYMKRSGRGGCRGGGEGGEEKSDQMRMCTKWQKENGNTKIHGDIYWSHWCNTNIYACTCLKSIGKPYIRLVQNKYLPFYIKNIAHVQYSSLNGAINTRMQTVATLVLVMAKYNEHTASIQTDLSMHCINKNIMQYWQRSILPIIKLSNTDIHCSEINITRLFPQTIFDIHQHMM